MKEYTDNEIIECLRNRDSCVVHYLWNRYNHMVKLMVKQLGGNNEDARDIFQESLMIILEKIDSGEFALTCKFKTFLYSISEHLWKSIRLKRQRAANYFLRRNESDIENDFSETMDDKLYQDIFREAFDSLDNACKSVLRLYWEDYSPQEIAEKLDVSNGYVRRKKCESQAELIRRVKKHPGYKCLMEEKKRAGRVIGC
ncbi:MAG: RNA polymerase sigma factor [Bacteroidota bacterium]